MPLRPGDILTLGGVNFTLLPVSLREREDNIKKRRLKSRPVSPWPSLIALTIFQLLAIVQFKVAFGEGCPASIPTAILGVCAVMWIYFILLRSFRRVAFEMETIAFFLSTLSIAGKTAQPP